MHVYTYNMMPLVFAGKGAPLRRARRKKWGRCKTQMNEATTRALQLAQRQLVFTRLKFSSTRSFLELFALDIISFCFFAFNMRAKCYEVKPRELLNFT
jgi:hypothetical protein